MTEDKAKFQPAWPAGSNTDALQYHDSLQYHFFLPGIFVAGRVFRTKTLEQHSAWMYDEESGTMTELFTPSYTRMDSATDTLRLESDEMLIEDNAAGGVFDVKKAGLKVEFNQRRVVSWLPAGQSDNAVIHRPDLKCSLEYKGKKLEGSGYSKRYYGWYERFWGYRFIHGVTDCISGNPLMCTHFWNADAAFGDNKYNYFKVLVPTGKIISSETTETWQQDTSAYATIDGQRWETRIKPLCTWETVIGGQGFNMESKMQNRYCTVELINGSTVSKGVAYNERCYGTLG